MMEHAGRWLGKISGYEEEERLGVTVTGVLSGRSAGKDRHKWPQRAKGNTTRAPCVTSVETAPAQGHEQWSATPFQKKI